ncbi:MAG: 50S ribosomal protein L13 [Candidatus Micrarchaeota archaeon]
MKLFDATNVIAGRLATRIVKELRKGEEVVVLNAEKAVISGNPKKVVLVYFKRRQMTNKSNPEHAAKWPRRPDFFFKKIVFGMLPKQSRKRLLKNLKVYVGVPKEFEGKQGEKAKTKESLGVRSISISEITRKLGFNP